MNLLNGLVKSLTGFGMLGLEFGGGGDSAVSDIAIPKFEPDPYYKQSQDVLFPYSNDLLAGKPNAYYSPIGQTGSVDFENMLKMSNRDITKGVDESLAKAGIGRGGLSASISSKAVADNSTTLRWSDFQRAILGKEFLLNTGMSGMSGVRSGALTNQGQVNDFALGATKLALGQAEAKDKAQAEQDQMWGDLMKAGISAAAIIATGGLAAPAVAGGAAAAGAGGIGGSFALGSAQAAAFPTWAMAL